MSEPIQPALTAEQWKFWLDGGDYREEMLRAGYDHITDSAYREHQNFHALAALAMYGQPFGFTWDDVRRLRELGYMNLDRHADGPPLASIADRIAALLPPENPPVSP